MLAECRRIFHRTFPGAVLPLMAVSLACFTAPATAETRFVNRGQSLQTVLNAAVAGDVIVLEAGAEFVGNFVLPVKSGTLPIVVRSTPSSLLPPAGTRIRPSHAPLLARIRSSNTMSALRTAAGTRNWELRYLEFAANQSGYGDLIQLGDGSKTQNTLSMVPAQLVLSHLYIHGDPLQGQKRCVALNAAHVTIRDSHISDCKGVGMDTQAIGGWNGPGPYTIENNYLEGAGENVLFGGSDPGIPNLVATGITFRKNHVARPFAWRNAIIATPQGLAAAVQTGGTLPAGLYGYRIVARRPVGQGTIGQSAASVEVVANAGTAGASVQVTWKAVPDATEYRVYGRIPGGQAAYWTVKTTSFVDSGSSGTAGSVPTSAGSKWTVKNLFELKNARDVLIDGNVFENHWKDAQAGYAIVFTPRNSGGTCGWCVVERVRFEYNIVRHVGAGVNVLGYDDDPATPSQQTNAITFRHNLFYDLSSTYGGNGWFLLMGGEPRDITVDHNTISHHGGSLTFTHGGTSTDPREVLGMRITNNAARHGSYGINGQNFSYGNAVINAYYPDGIVTGNYLAGGSASRYPAGNRFAGTFEAEFVNAAANDYRLVTGSQLRGTATDGGDIGADMGALLSRVASVVDGTGAAVPAPAAPTNVRVRSE